METFDDEQKSIEFALMAFFISITIGAPARQFRTSPYHLRDHPALANGAE
jgi:hypothetical protein